MKLEDVLTAGEAAEIWGKAHITVRQACSGFKDKPPRFKAGEYRQSGKVWLVTRKAMERVFGVPPMQDSKSK